MNKQQNKLQALVRQKKINVSVKELGSLETINNK